MRSFPVAWRRSQLAPLLVALLFAVAIPARSASGAASAAASSGHAWRLLGTDRETAPPGPPGLTAVTAEVSVPRGIESANRHSVQIRVLAVPATLKPYVSWHVYCGPGQASFAGDGFHTSSFTKTLLHAANCEADVTATLYFWAGASGVTVWIYER